MICPYCLLLGICPVCMALPDIDPRDPPDDNPPDQPPDSPRSDECPQ